MLRAMEQMSRISSRDVECEAKNTSAQRGESLAPETTAYRLSKAE